MVGLAYHHDSWLGIFLFGLVAAGRGAQLLVRNIWESRYGIRSTEYRSRRWFILWLIMIAAGTDVMIELQLPMLLSFLVSRPALDRIANKALADPTNADALADQRAGLYRITGVEVIGNTVVLYVGKERGNYGFARVPGAASDVISNQPGFEGFSGYHRDFPKQENFRDPEGRRIKGDWFVMYSSYWLTKVGWS
jgi:hypothetical protein